MSDAKTKAKAKILREQQLKQTTEILTACTCTYPIRICRNMHGHETGCPAIKIWERYHDSHGEG